MRGAWCFVVLGLVAACRSKGGPPAEPVDAGLAARLARPPPPAPPRDHGQELIVEGCLSCHTEEILRQQRLSAAQWEKVVKKMAGWGANVSSDDLPVVSAYLATHYGPDAGTYEVGYIGPAQADREIAPLDDGSFAGGTADRGGSIYATRCASCHGADARGQVGVNLVDRPLLYRAADFARTLRDGRAKMPAQPSTTDGEVADLLAHLRRLHPAR